MSYLFSDAVQPKLLPPLLTQLPRPKKVKDEAALPASKRFKSTRYPTLQDEIDQVDYLEQQWYTSKHEIRGFGFSWLVPLGRQNTQEEDQESTYTNSPPATSPQLQAQPNLDDNNVTDDDDEGNRPIAVGGERARDGPAAEGAIEEVDLDAEIEDADATNASTNGEENDDDDDDDEAEEEEDEEAMQSAEEAEEGSSLPRSANSGDEEHEDGMDGEGPSSGAMSEASMET